MNITKRASLITIIGLLMTSVIVAPSSAVSSTELEGANIIFQKTNELRASVGAQSLKRNTQVDGVAYNWSVKLLTTGQFKHNPNYSDQITGSWTLVGENIAMSCRKGGMKKNVDALFVAWVNSPGHYSNMVNKNFTDIGIGVAYDSGSDCAYATQNFARYQTSNGGGNNTPPPANNTTPPPNPFIDINPNAKPGQKGHTNFNTQIQWAFQNNVTNGWSTPKGREFRPKESITREAMAAFLYRQYGRGDTVNLNVLNRFKDVNRNSQFAKEIAWMAQNGYTTGYADGTFRPKDNIKRDAVAAFLHRISQDKGFAGKKANNAVATKAFSDVKTNPHLSSIAWMTQNNITTGYTADKTFRPHNDVTREAVVAFLYRIERNL